MLRRTLLKAMIASVVALGLPKAVSSQTPDEQPTPAAARPSTCRKRFKAQGDLKTFWRRRGAPANPACCGTAALRRFGAGLGSRRKPALLFGPYPNYANSPVPRGRWSAWMLNGGRSYWLALPLRFWMLGRRLRRFGYSGHHRRRHHRSHGRQPGTNYAAPVVSITDTTGSGAREAFIGPPFTGGIRSLWIRCPDWASRTPTTAASSSPWLCPIRPPIRMPITMYRAGRVLSAIAHRPAADKAARLPPGELDDLNVNTFHYLGPQIIASRDRPVRILFATACRQAQAAISLSRWIRPSWEPGWGLLRNRPACGFPMPKTAPASTCTAA